jgi:hypothetical protein
VDRKKITTRGRARSGIRSQPTNCGNPTWHGLLAQWH